MLEFVLVRVNLGASHALVFAWKLKLFCHFLKSQTSDVSQFLAASWAMVVYPMLAAGANCVAIWALQEPRRTRNGYIITFLISCICLHNHQNLNCCLIARSKPQSTLDFIIIQVAQISLQFLFILMEKRVEVT
jgi:hypothetical protein